MLCCPAFNSAPGSAGPLLYFRDLSLGYKTIRKCPDGILAFTIIKSNNGPKLPKDETQELGWELDQAMAISFSPALSSACRAFITSCSQARLGFKAREGPASPGLLSSLGV